MSFTTLDLEQAYDTVWRDGLSHNLAAINRPMYLQKLIMQYINNRKIQVKYQNQLFNKVTTSAGLPQGSVTSLTLFKIYVNNIPKADNTIGNIFRRHSGGRFINKKRNMQEVCSKTSRRNHRILP